MTRDNLIRMALENGWPEKKDFVYAVHDAAFKAGRTAEREASAKVCDELADTAGEELYYRAYIDAAAQIRARGEK